MSLNIKNTVIATALIAVTIPFILVTDIFPFLRFGMFAEPIKIPSQQELFILTFINASNEEKEFNSKEIGIEPHFFYYLMRNYYYRKQSELMIDNIKNIENIHKLNIKEWRLKRIVLDNKSIPTKADTTVVFPKANE